MRGAADRAAKGSWWARPPLTGGPATFFAQKGCRINAGYFIGRMLAAYNLSSVIMGAGDRGFQFQKDNGAARAAVSTRQHLNKGKIAMLGGIKWPAVSPDLNPLVYGRSIIFGGARLPDIKPLTCSDSRRFLRCGTGGPRPSRSKYRPICAPLGQMRRYGRGIP